MGWQIWVTPCIGGLLELGGPLGSDETENPFGRRPERLRAATFEGDPCACRTGHTFTLVGDPVAPADLVERQRAWQADDLLADPRTVAWAFSVAVFSVCAVCVRPA